MHPADHRVLSRAPPDPSRTTPRSWYHEVVTSDPHRFKIPDRDSPAEGSLEWPSGSETTPRGNRLVLSGHRTIDGSSRRRRDASALGSYQPCPPGGGAQHWTQARPIAGCSEEFAH